MSSMSNDNAIQAAALKPCPFCGSDQVSMSFSATMQSPEPNCRFVECEQCAASGPFTDIEPMGDEAAKANAARMWNLRAIEAAAPLLRAEVEREVVEWLRQTSASGAYSSDIIESEYRNEFADAIQRGDHRKGIDPTPSSP